MSKYFLKRLDNYLGQIVRFLPRSQLPAQIKTPTSILIIRPGGIGDAVLLAPAIRLLKTSHPLTRITILAEQRNAGVLALVPGVDEVFCYDRPSEFLQAVRSRYDVVIDSEQSYRLSAVVARLLRAPVRIGFDTNHRRRMFTHSVPYSQQEYETASFTGLLTPLGIECGRVLPAVPFLTVPEEVSRCAAEKLKQVPDELFVTIFPGASIRERRWGADRFRRAAGMLAAFGVGIVVIGGEDDYRQGEIIAGGGRGINLAGMTTLPETAAVIQKSALLLSGDSGLLHIAVGLDVPTVSLFGPGRAEKWAPKGDRHIVINKGLPCSPCTTFGNTPPCPVNVRCMNDISVDEVVNAVTMLLTGVGAMPSRCCTREWIETNR